jgi:hypothetical protein
MTALPLALRLDALRRSVRSMAEDGVDRVLGNAGLGLAGLRGGLGRFPWATARLPRPRRLRVMAPPLHATRRRVCRDGCAHFGRLRVALDPFERLWWGWWTCCCVGEVRLSLAPI